MELEDEEELSQDNLDDVSEENSQENIESAEEISSASNITDDYASEDDEELRAKNKDYMDSESDEQQLLYEGIFDDDFDDTGNWRAVQNEEAFDNNFSNEIPMPPYQANQVIFQAIPNELRENPTPLGCFQLYYSDNILNEITRQTNLYKDQTLAKIRGKNKPIRRYLLYNTRQGFSVDDIIAYHCILLGLSIIPLPNISYIWNDCPFLKFTLSSLLFRDKFRVLDKFFHLNDNENNSSDSILHKINPFISIINNVSQNVWPPNTALCIDEAVEPFKGRSKLVMFHPQKPHKWGIRLYVLTCATSGFTLNIEICQGKQQEPINNKLESLVLRMVNLYNNFGYYLAMDNLYTTINLFNKLQQSQFRALGTIRSNRLLLTQQQKRLIHFDAIPQGGIVSMIQQNLHTLFWKPQEGKERLVLVLNNFFGYKFDRNSSQDQKLREILTADGIDCSGQEKPIIVSIYNKYTHGTDRRNQLMETFRINKKNLKWWKALYQGLFSTVVVNSWKIYQQLTEQQIAHRKFRENLLDELIQKYKKDLYNSIFIKQEKQKNPLKESLNHYAFDIQMDDKNVSKNKKGRHQIQTENKRVCVICKQRTRELCNSCFDKKGKNKGLHHRCTHIHQQQILKKTLNQLNSKK